MKKAILFSLLAIAFSLGVHAQKSVKISVFADHIFDVVRQDSISLEEAARRVFSMGVGGVDVYVNMDTEKLMTLQKAGLRPASAILVADLVNNDCTEEIKNALSFCHRYGCISMLVVPGLLPDKPSAEVYKNLYNRLRNLAIQGKNEGISITVEDYDNAKSPCFNTMCLDQMFKACPDLGLTFDTGNFAVCNEDVMMARRHFDGKIKHVHLKDRKTMGQWEVVAVGTGCVPTKDFVESLLNKGYDGWFTIECYGSKNMLEDIRTGAENVKRFAPRAEPKPENKETK